GGCWPRELKGGRERVRIEKQTQSQQETTVGSKKKKPPAGETTGVNGVSDGGDLNHRRHTTVNGGGGKAQSVAERLFENGGENLSDAGLRAAKRGWKIFPCNG